MLRQHMKRVWHQKVPGQQPVHVRGQQMGCSWLAHATNANVHGTAGVAWARAHKAAQRSTREPDSPFPRPASLEEAVDASPNPHQASPSPSPSPSPDGSPSPEAPAVQGPTSALVLPWEQSTTPAPTIVLTYTTTLLPMCSMQEIQTLLNNLELPQYALKVLKDQGMTGSDLLLTSVSDLVHDPRFKLPPLVAHKIHRVTLSWQLMCLLCGSDVRVVLDQHQFEAALKQAGLQESCHSAGSQQLTPEYPPSSPAQQPRQCGIDFWGRPLPPPPPTASPQQSPSEHRPLRGLTRCRVLFTSALDVDGDCVVALEDLVRGLPLLSKVLLEELWSLPESSHIPDPVLNQRILHICSQVMAPTSSPPPPHH